MSNPAQRYPSIGTFVEIVEGIGEWFVRIVEDGEQTAMQPFELESFAIVFAEGQRMRLGPEPEQVKKLFAA